MKRTVENMVRKREWILTEMEREHAAGRTKRGERALKRARRGGVLLDRNVRCGYVPAHDDNNWIIGPDAVKDNIYQAIPQVSLHGFDEGLVKKLNFGALEMCIRYCRAEHKVKASQVNALQCYITMLHCTALQCYITMLHCTVQLPNANVTLRSSYCIGLP